MNGLQFRRLAFSGTAPNQLEMNGFIYATVDNDRTILIMFLAGGKSAQAEVKLLEAAVATFKKR